MRMSSAVPALLGFVAVLNAAAAPPVHVTVSEGTSMSVAVSPDGRTLAIDLQGSIWTLPAGGGAAKRITDLYNDARQPVWSPDGAWITFFAYRDGGYDLWAVAPDGSHQHKLTWGAFDDREPVWSHDGTRVAFSSDRGNPLGSEFATDPCRSSFDSVLYALGALSGQAAYDFATSIGSPSDAYAILKGSRKTGVQEMAPPGSTGTGKVIMDEGLSKGPPEPPPYKGLQPTTISGTGTKSLVGPYTPGNGMPPAAALRYVPTVCQ